MSNSRLNWFLGIVFPLSDHSCLTGRHSDTHSIELSAVGALIQRTLPDLLPANTEFFEQASIGRVVLENPPWGWLRIESRDAR